MGKDGSRNPYSSGIPRPIINSSHKGLYHEVIPRQKVSFAKMRIRTRIKAIARKNIPDLKARILGRYPRFVYRKGFHPMKDAIPVFVFHEVGSRDFERKLIHLKENGYETIDCSEFMNCLGRGEKGASKKVLLTFDDGHISLWQDAYPLLKKYDFKATGFVCPGLVPDEEDSGSPKKRRKLCNWDEIRTMHASGHVDFQAHGLYHDLVFTSSKVIGILGTGFESHFMGKQDRLRLLTHGQSMTLTNLWPYDEVSSIGSRGWPVFEHKPRFAADSIFRPSQEILEQLQALTERSLKPFPSALHHGRHLFQEILRKKAKHELGESVTNEEYKKEMVEDLRQTKEVLEQKLSGSQVIHFCPPWFQATETALRAAFECGYVSAFLGCGAYAGTHSGTMDRTVRQIPRLSEKYLFRLPTEGEQFALGTGRKPMSITGEG
jgi:hypothetical protein